MAEAEDFDHRLHTGVGSGYYDWQAGPTFSHLPENLQPISVRELHVQDQDIGGKTLKSEQGFGAGSRERHLVPAREIPLVGAAKRFFVFDKEDSAENF
jgi:hypothetical protein